MKRIFSCKMDIFMVKCKIGDIMAEKMFKIENNQKVWNFFFESAMEEWDTENKEKLEAIIWTDKEKELYSQKTHGDISPQNITPYRYESKKRRMCLQQYKPIVLEFEEFVNKSFDEITADDIDKFSGVTSKKNKLNHLNAFLLSGIKSGIIKNTNKDFLISLLPEIYREIGRKIAE